MFYLYDCLLAVIRSDRVFVVRDRYQMFTRLSAGRTIGESLETLNAC